MSSRNGWLRTDLSNLDQAVNSAIRENILLSVFSRQILPKSHFLNGVGILSVQKGPVMRHGMFQQLGK